MNYVYLLECADGTLYCGWTTDPVMRLAVHNAGRGAKYTRSRLPVRLVYTEAFADRHDALSREWHIKKMSRAEKERLICEGQGSGRVLWCAGAGPDAGREETEEAQEGEHRAPADEA